MGLRVWLPATLLTSVLAAMALPGPHAQAAEYRSIGPDPAIFYDAPTTRGRKVAIGPRGMPLEVVVLQNDWVRVRDASGEMSWVERRQLSDKRTLVTVGAVSAHAAADESSPVMMRLDPGVIVDLVEAPSNGWVSVRHRDGEAGWLKVSQVWGN